MPDDLLVNLVDSRAVVEALLDTLPQMFTGSTTVRSLPSPAQTLVMSALIFLCVLTGIHLS